MKNVFITFAKYKPEEEHQIVGVFSDEEMANKRLNVFPHGIAIHDDDYKLRDCQIACNFENQADKNIVQVFCGDYVE